MELIKTKAWESLVIIKLIIGTGAGEHDGVGGVKLSFSALWGFFVSFGGSCGSQCSVFTESLKMSGSRIEYFYWEAGETGHIGTKKMQGQRCDRDVEARVVSIPDIYIIFIFVFPDTSIGWV